VDCRVQGEEIRYVGFLSSQVCLVRVCLVKVYRVECRVQGAEMRYVGFLSNRVCLVRV